MQHGDQQMLQSWMAKILPPLCNITQGCYAITHRAARHESALLRTLVLQQCWFDSCKDDMCKHLARHGNQSYPSNIATLRLGSFSFIQRDYIISFHYTVNCLECRGNCSATLNNIKLVHWPLMGGLLHLVQRGGKWARPQPE